MSHTIPLTEALQRGSIATASAGLCALHLHFAKKRFGRRGPFSTSGSGTPSQCRLCGGSGRRVCTVCAGRGALGRGGFSRRNTVRIAHLVGSKWTSVTAIGGKWRHFLCVGRRGNTTSNAVARLSSTCGPVENRLTIEVPIKQLRSRANWEGGWTTLADIAANEEKMGDDTHASGATCSACAGRCAIPCPRCDGLGQVGL